jgi:transcriptional regulator with XRE-family HTH domain
MSAFGTEVKRRLAAIGKDPSWLHTQTGLSHSTIHNWFRKESVTPLPSTVARVAKALGCAPEDLSASAGYGVRYSKDDGERERRRAAILAARPDWGEKVIDRLPQLGPDEEDYILSMIESVIDTTLRRRRPPEESR